MMTGNQHEGESRFVVCVKDEGYPASPELRKIYRAGADVHAAEHHLIQVIDESGEDYACPAEYFVPIELPEAVEEAITLTPTSSLEADTGDIVRFPSKILKRTEPGLSGRSLAVAQLARIGLL